MQPHASLAALTLAVVLSVPFAGAVLHAQARTMVATIYDDGRSCPGACDAHVVFHPQHNGTANAFEPSSTRSAPAQCVAGKPCTICFAAADSSCMSVLYRGSGPPRGRFDFTPSFFEEHCGRDGVPPQLAAMCASAAPAVARLKARVNCVAAPTHPKCMAMMAAAAARKAADDALFMECKAVGEAAFNAKHAATPQLQRSVECAYEKNGTGRNSKGDTWRRLLDGACRPNTYAGRDGLDCCSGSVFAAAMLGPECRGFFVEP